MAIVAARYGTGESQPLPPSPYFSPPLRIIDGSHEYQSRTHADARAKYWAQSRITLRGGRGLAMVTHRFDALLLTINCSCSAAFTLRHPGYLRRFYLSPAPTSRRPRSPAGTFDDKLISRQPKA